MEETTDLKGAFRVGELKQYSMQETLTVADEGAVIIEDFLNSYPASISVINVEKDKRYQTLDIDFLWVIKELEKKETVKRIELKVDRYTSANFFFETHSNLTKQTPGCFMYTEADYLFYYFIEKEELYVLPVEPVRQWFLANLDRFEEKHLQTKRESGAVLYGSSGRLVPIKTLMAELCWIPGLKVHTVPNQRAAA